MGKVEEKVVRKQLSKVSNYKQVFATQVGKKVLFDLMKVHHVTNSTFVANDPYSTALREGERNVVLRILTLMEYDEKHLQKLLEEAKIDAE